MKRSGMKPRTTPIARTAIKRKVRETRPRKRMRRRAVKPAAWEDRENRKVYVAKNLACELCTGMCIRKETREFVRYAQDPHHILGRGWLGADDARNLIACCRTCHNRVQDSKDGEIECWLVKVRDGTFDPAWLTSASGFQVLGRISVWVECGAVSNIKAAEEVLNFNFGEKS